MRSFSSTMSLLLFLSSFVSYTKNLLSRIFANLIISSILKSNIFLVVLHSPKQIYASDLLAKAKMLEAFKINTPIVSKTTHSRDDHGPIDSIEYCQLCDSLQYLILTRPDLTHVVNLM